MRSKKGFLYLLCVSILQVLFLYGCGGKNDPIQESVYTVNTEEYDLATNEWKAFQQIEEADTKFAVVNYLEDFCPIPEPEMTRWASYSATEQDMYYDIQLYYVPLEEGEHGANDVYYLYSLNTTTLETSTVRLDFNFAEILQEAGGNASISGLDVAEGKLCAFTVVRDPEDNLITQYYALRMNQEGTMEQLVDLLPAIRENLHLQTDRALNIGAVCDSREHYYVINRESPEILILDEEGKKQGLVVLQDFADVMIVNTCKTPDGVPIFEYNNLDGLTVIFSLDGTEKTILYVGEKETARLRNVDAFGNVLFLENRKLVWWDAVQGMCRWVYDMGGMLRCEAILHNTAEEVSLICDDGGKTYFYKLKAVSEDSESAKKEIVLLGRIEKDFAESLAAQYNTTHPDVVITVKIPDSEEADSLFWNRTVEEMKGGKGPDMLILSRQQFVDFERAGVLKNLSSALPEELQEQLFPQALQYGTLGGELYGIPYRISIQTFFVSNEVWEGDNWKLQDMMGVIKQREAEQRAPGRIINMSYGTTASQMLSLLCMHALGDGSFVDMEQKKCSFETEEFYELLRLCKKYGDDPDNVEYLDMEERVQEIADGEALLYYCAAGLWEFCRHREMLGDGYHCVGYPTNGENYSFVGCYDCIAVNKWTEHEEVINDFLQFLLGEKEQAGYPLCVRRDLILKQADSSPYVKEYLALMDKSSLLLKETEIEDIIFEEAEAYFAGDKSEQETAKVIQNRVQVYLDERN